MALRTWALTFALVSAIAIVAVAGGGAARARSEHSRPAVHVRESSVVVTAKGKLFHRAGCKYIHGTPKTIATAGAEREGYSPCTRCYHDALVDRAGPPLDEVHRGTDVAAVEASRPQPP